MRFEVFINSATINTSALSRQWAKKAFASHLYEIGIEWTVLKLNQGEKKRKAWSHTEICYVSLD